MYTYPHSIDVPLAVTLAYSPIECGFVYKFSGDYVHSTAFTDAKWYRCGSVSISENRYVCDVCGLYLVEELFDNSDRFSVYPFE